MSYIETAVRYDKIMENGSQKRVTERFLVDALSFTEAEARTTEQLTPYISGEFEVSATKKTKIAEIFNSDGADIFFLAKVAFIHIDERTGAEKRTLSQWLIGGTDFNDAYEALLRQINKCMTDIEIVSLARTPIIEYYPAKL